MMKFDYYKEKDDIEEKISLSTALDIAESHGMDRDKAKYLLHHPELGQFICGKTRVWAEEAM